MDERVEMAIHLALTILFGGICVAFGIAQSYRPVRRADGRVEQVHVEHIQAWREDRNREFAYDELNGDVFHGALPGE